MKPTREQYEAVEDVARAMCELSELWDENFNRIFEELGEDVTRDLLTRSFNEMASAWVNFRHCVGDLTNANRVNGRETWDEEDTDSPKCECCIVME